MKTRLLCITLLMSQFLFSQFGDQLLEKKNKQLNSRNLNVSQSIKEFGSCDADCFSPNVFSPHLNNSTFKVSHGSPTFSGGNSIWMWSYGSGSRVRGEGVFTNFNFQKGRTYCIEADIELSRSGTTEPIYSNATFNIDAANAIIANPVNSSGGQLPNITQKQSIISGNYSSGVYPFNNTFKIRKTYTPNTNYSQLWIYPKNPGKPHPQLNMRISNLVIKEVISCPCEIKGTIRVKQRENCEYQFYANTTSNANTSIKGYLWKFGDGSTSTEKNPKHTYSKGGNYTTTLTVYGTNKNGECCTETFTTKIKVSDKCKVNCEIKAKFTVARRGFWFWRCYDFVNTSTTNASTTIIGYEWYVDGNLVSTQKDLKNYKRSAKNVCLIVYSIDVNGNCCSDKYCSNTRHNIILNKEIEKF